MDGRAISDDGDASFDMAQQVLDDLNHLGAFDAAFVNLEVEAPQTQPANQRKAFPVEALKEQWRLAAWYPSAHTRGLGAQPAFVDEDDDPPLPSGVFLPPATSCAAIDEPLCHHAQWPAAPVAGRRSPVCPAPATHGPHGSARQRSFR